MLKLPVATIEEIVKTPVPLLVKVTALAGLVLPISCCVKLKLVGEKLTAGVPVPLFTTCDSTAEVLGRNVASPPYTPVIECVPTVSVEVVNFAIPLLSVLEPNVVVPSLKVTVPVGVPVVDFTEAVNVTDWPKIEGFSEDDNAVEVLNLPILLRKPW
jgi:hypothetical protein